MVLQAWPTCQHIFLNGGHYCQNCGNSMIVRQFSPQIWVSRLMPEQFRLGLDLKLHDCLHWEIRTQEFFAFSRI